MLNALVLFF